MVPLGVIWHAWCLYFGVLGDPGTILGRSWDDPGTLEDTRKDPVSSRLGFYRFFVDLGYPFWKLFGYFWTKQEYFFISISRLLFLMIFKSKFGCLGSEKQAFGMEGIAKIDFRRNWISYDSRVDFSWFWVALGPIFMAFVALETGLKINEFSCDFGVIPDPEPRVVWWRLAFFLGTVNSPGDLRNETWDMRNERSTL